MNEQVTTTTRKPLEPHRYPLQIVMAGGIVIVLFVYTLVFLVPKYRAAYQHMLAADSAYAKKNFTIAKDEYKKVLEAVPSSENTKISLAKTLFANNEQDDDVEALLMLENVELGIVDWRELQEVMPENYEGLFNSNYPVK